MAKQPTPTEMILQMKNHQQKGLEEVRHDMREERIKIIAPIEDKLEDIDKKVTIIEEREKQSAEKRVEMLDMITAIKNDVMGHSSSKFRTLWAVGTIIVIGIGIMIDGVKDEVKSLKEEIAIIRDEHNYALTKLKD